MKTRSLIVASVLALSLSGYAVAQNNTTTTTTGTTGTTQQTVQPSANQTGTSTDQTQMQSGTTASQSGTTTNDQMKTGQSNTTTTTTTDQNASGTTATTTDQNASGTTAKQTTTAAMPSDIMVPADQMKGAQIWMANDFIGKTVYSENNENVGDINDVIFSKDGKIVGVVLGVGGFLGIGEKNVLVRLDALKMVKTNTANNTSGTGTTTSTDNTTQLGTNNTGTANDNAAIDNNNYQLVISTTKEALEAAPSFDRKTRSYTTNQ